MISFEENYSNFQIKVVVKQKLFILIFLFNILFSQEKIAYIIPFNAKDTEARLFNPHDRDGAGKAWCDLRDALQKHGYKVALHYLNKKLPKKAPVLACDVPVWAKHWQKNLPKNRHNTVLFIWEPPTILPWNYLKEHHNQFGTVLTMFDHLIDNQRYKKYHFPQPYLNVLNKLVPFSEKKLCTMFAGFHKSQHPSELYSYRQRVIYFFESNSPYEFDLYGNGWEHLRLKVFKGRVPHKAPVMKRYKFAICCENMCNQKGYVTEKIFDVMAAGSVPVYWGADNIDSYVPKGCYIPANEYKTIDDLYSFLNNMPEEEYNIYLHNIQLFFASEEAYYFSIPYFIDTILSAMLPDYTPTLLFSSAEIKLINHLKNNFNNRHTNQQKRNSL